MMYSFLQSYQIENESVTVERAKEIAGLRHNFFAVPDSYIKRATETFNPFPTELLEFYKEIGFGFFHRKKTIENVLLDPMSVVYINLREGYMAEDETVQEYLPYYNAEEKLLFFHTAEQQYLAISRQAQNGKNAVWYKNEQLSSSLSELLKAYHNDNEFISWEISCIEFRADKERRKREKEAKKPKRERMDYFAGHKIEW